VTEYGALSSSAVATKRSAAKLLGMSRGTLINRLERLNLPRPKKP
jgi:predicted DNA-binding transcriptional regulator AlpA